MARAGKCKLGARAGKYKFGARAGKYKLGAKTSKYKFGARAGGQVKGRGPENADTRERLLLIILLLQWFICFRCLFIITKKNDDLPCEETFIEIRLCNRRRMFLKVCPNRQNIHGEV